MEDFEALRAHKDPEVFRIFYGYFVSAIVGQVVWNQKVNNALVQLKRDESWKGEPLCTASDEAFALLCLANGWDRWLDMLKIYKGHLQPPEQGEVAASEVQYKYTSRRQDNKPKDDMEDDGEQKESGWTREGIEKFNEYFDLVVASRKRYGNAEMQFLEQMLDKETDKRRRPGTGVPKAESYLVARADSDTSDNEEESETESENPAKRQKKTTRNKTSANDNVAEANLEEVSDSESVNS